MNDIPNPYQPPNFDLEPFEPSVDEFRKFRRLVMFAWPIVFGLNLIMPLLLAVYVTQEHGRIGIGVALLFFFILGWYFCYAKPRLANRLIFGSVVSALTQLFPVIHVVAGVIAIAIAENAGLMRYGDDMQLGSILSEAGGFVVTLIVGAILVSFAMAVGFCLALFFNLSQRRESAESVPIARSAS